MLPCVDFPGNPPPWYPQGLGACGQIDLDFGASPTLFDIDGRKVVGDGQKSGVFHVFDADDMSPVWSTIAAPPGAVGGLVGSATLQDGSFVSSATGGGYLPSLDAATGALQWIAPTLDGAHYSEPVASANGVVYTVDFKGFLDAYDQATGLPLLHRPMILGAEWTPPDPIVDWGGVSIARNTVYAGVGISGLPTGYVIAFRPAPLP
jgi:outer membrane protein assembly factor BamB